VWKAMLVELAGREWPYRCKTFGSKVEKRKIYSLLHVTIHLMSEI